MAVRQKSLDNLKPFKKGADERRNSSGANRKPPELSALLAEVYGDNQDAKAVLMAQHKKALKGDARAAEFIYGYLYGKPKQGIDLDLSDETIEITRKIVGGKI